MKSVKSVVGLTAILAALVAAPTGPAAEQGPVLSLAWAAPTPRDGTTLTVYAGSPVTLEVAARGARGVRVGVHGLTRGVSFRLHGASARLVWMPTIHQLGDHVFTFVARSGSRLARPRTVFVHVTTARQAAILRPYPLSGPGGLSRYAAVVERVVARTEPSSAGPAIVRLARFTPEGTPNLVLALERTAGLGGEWVRIRLPILPNNTTGWVPRSALGPYRGVWTHLVVDRETFTATLYRKGRPIFRTRVGVGRSYLPTPRGRYYVRVKLTGYDNPMYGPLAFGLSARSPLLERWPGGGHIGIHGTNKPELIPGGVSHGCVRMKNQAILRLARLMPLGTPVTIV